MRVEVYGKPVKEEGKQYSLNLAISFVLMSSFRQHLSPQKIIVDSEGTGVLKAKLFQGRCVELNLKFRRSDSILTKNRLGACLGYGRFLE